MLNLSKGKIAKYDAFCRASIYSGIMITDRDDRVKVSTKVKHSFSLPHCS